MGRRAADASLRSAPASPIPWAAAAPQRARDAGWAVDARRATSAVAASLARPTTRAVLQQPPAIRPLENSIMSTVRTPRGSSRRDGMASGRTVGRMLYAPRSRVCEHNPHNRPYVLVVG